MENNISDKIQDYLDGLLSGEELKAFERQMETDDDLRNLVSLHREVQSILSKREQEETKAFKVTLMRAAKEFRDGQQSSSGITLIRILPWLAAACVLIVFAISIFDKKEELYQLPVLQSEIVRGETENEKYEQAVVLFNTGKYLDSRILLADLTKEDSTVVQYRYYEALTFVGTEQWAGAISRLQPIAEGTSVFADEAKYYLAVVYIKDGNPDKAKPLLAQIPQTGKLGEKAGKLLKTL